MWCKAEVLYANPFCERRSNARNEEIYLPPATTRHMTSVWKRRLLRTLGTLGILAAFPFLAWFALGWIEVVPSMVDTFGAVGLRTPAAITVGGLLLAAIGFYDL
ncbi:MAG: hypothetical protein WBM71_18765 [Sedimenticolaceae bacterium]